MCGKRSRHAILSFFVVFLIGISFSRGVAQAALKDSDVDGITDDAEQQMYHTDPKNHDTDGDGFDDGYEVVHGADPLNAADDPISLEMHATQVVPVAWFIARASGILAFILFSVVVINGLLMTTRIAVKAVPIAFNYTIHTFFALAAFSATIGHVVSLTLDQYFRLTWFEAIVPFSVHRDFASGMGFDLRWALGIGSIAFYGMIALIVTSELKGRLLRQKIWRAIHYASFPSYFLFLFHGIFSGTDTRTWWMVWLYALSGTIVAVLVGIRIFLSLQKRRLAAANVNNMTNSSNLAA